MEQVGDDLAAPEQLTAQDGDVPVALRAEAAVGLVQPVVRKRRRITSVSPAAAACAASQ